jgi:hypothetical protein
VITKKDLLREIAKEMAKPLNRRNKLLRKHLGDKLVDEWEQTWASDREISDNYPDLFDRGKMGHK